jgi:hypothetical protein
MGVDTMDSRGPYRLYTKGMKPDEASRWFNSNPGKRVNPYQGESDLGPDIKIPMGKMSNHRTKGTWDALRLGGVEWYHQGHLLGSHKG